MAGTYSLVRETILFIGGNPVRGRQLCPGDSTYVGGWGWQEVKV